MRETSKPTPKTRKERQKPYPYWVCYDCGIKANRETCLKKYGAEPKKPCFDVSTYHKEACDVCGEVKMVTEAKDFFYPEFRGM